MPNQHDSRPQECAELFAQLSAYLDGELPEQERRRLEEHLCQCPPCIEFIQSLRRTIGLCRNFEPDAPPPEVPPELRQRLRAVFEEALKSSRGSR